jgi:hypothetical protein
MKREEKISFSAVVVSDANFSCLATTANGDPRKRILDGYRNEDSETTRKKEVELVSVSFCLMIGFIHSIQ